MRVPNPLLSEFRFGLYRKLLPTPEAQSLFPETVSAFAAFDIVQKRAADLQAGRAGGLNIVAISAFANALLPTAVAKFRQTRPDVVITLQSMSALQVATHVANHQADLGFVIDSIAARGVSVSDLWATNFGCVMPHTHPLASKLHVVASEPPQIATSASSVRMRRAASPIACTLAAQAVTGVPMGPLKP